MPLHDDIAAFCPFEDCESNSHEYVGMVYDDRQEFIIATLARCNGCEREWRLEVTE